MKRFSKYIILTLALAVITAASAGCNKKASEDATVNSAEAQALGDMSALTPEQLRAHLGDTDLKISELISIYEQLKAKDTLTYAETMKLAALYDLSGRAADEYALLSELFDTQPSDFLYELINSIVISRSADEPAIKDMAAQIFSLISEEPASMEALGQMLTNETFAKEFGDTHPGFVKKTLVTDSQGRAVTVSFDGYEINVEGLMDGFLHRMIADGTGVSWQKAGFSNDHFNGPFTLLFKAGGWDMADADRVTGTMANDMATGEIKLTAGGVTYTGAFSETGEPTVEQSADRWTIIYAYNDDKSAYLYETPGEEGPFIFNAAWLGLTAPAAGSHDFSGYYYEAMTRENLDAINQALIDACAAAGGMSYAPTIYSSNTPAQSNDSQGGDSYYNDYNDYSGDSWGGDGGYSEPEPAPAPVQQPQPAPDTNSGAGGDNNANSDDGSNDADIDPNDGFWTDDDL